MTHPVAAFTAGGASPSARFRVRQYTGALLEHGIALREFSNGWRGREKATSSFGAVLNCVTASGKSVVNALHSRKFDATLVQRWSLSGMPTTEIVSGRPRVWDVDDAIWLRLPACIVRRHAASFDRVICGNGFLAQEIEKWNTQVAVIPTAVDTNRFAPSGQTAGVRSICWTGSSPNLRRLYQVEAAVATVLARHPGLRLRVICDEPPAFVGLDPHSVDYIPWSAIDEVRGLQTATIGIMPLDDSAWCRGKCSYKMLCYMACGIPVVVSPVGMNAEVLGMDDVGLPARDRDAWIDGLTWLLSSGAERERLGRNGRRLAVSQFSIGAIAPRLASELKKVM